MDRHCMWTWQYLGLKCKVCVVLYMFWSDRRRWNSVYFSVIWRFHSYGLCNKKPSMWSIQNWQLTQIYLPTKILQIICIHLYKLTHIQENAYAINFKMQLYLIVVHGTWSTEFPFPFNSSLLPHEKAKLERKILFQWILLFKIEKQKAEKVKTTCLGVWTMSLILQLRIENTFAFSFLSPNINLSILRTGLPTFLEVLVRRICLYLTAYLCSLAKISLFKSHWNQLDGVITETSNKQNGALQNCGVQQRVLFVETVFLVFKND